MTTVQELVEQAYREGNFIALGSTLTPDQLSEGVRLLNSLWRSFLGNEIGVTLQDYQYPPVLSTGGEVIPTAHLPYPQNTNSYYQATRQWGQQQIYADRMPPNSRALVRVSAPTTLYFPEYPSDGARMAFVDAGSSDDVTLDGNGRKIEGLTEKTISPGAGPFEWFYRADMGNWGLLAPLTESDPSPLPPDFDDFFICGLSIRLQPRTGAATAAGTTAQFTRVQSQAKRRYFQRDPSPPVDTLPQPRRPWDIDTGSGF